VTGAVSYPTTVPTPRFAKATALLLQLSDKRNSPACSGFLGAMLRRPPSAIRRLTVLLRRSALVTTTKGPGGGAVLSRPRRAITLGDVWRAVAAAAPPRDVTVAAIHEAIEQALDQIPLERVAWEVARRHRDARLTAGRQGGRISSGPIRSPLQELL
jgi:DNA-binding IscR family transcriptional regulator